MIFEIRTFRDDSLFKREPATGSDRRRSSLVAFLASWAKGAQCPGQREEPQCTLLSRYSSFCCFLTVVTERVLNMFPNEST